MKVEDERKIETMDNSFIRRMQKKSLLDKIPTDELRAAVGVSPVRERIQKRRLMWFGHVVRMGEERLPKKAGKLQREGKRPRGRPKTRWSDAVRRDLQKMNITWREAEERATDRELWRTMINELKQ